jgi:hypothetical protein
MTGESTLAREVMACSRGGHDLHRRPRGHRGGEVRDHAHDNGGAGEGDRPAGA